MPDSAKVKPRIFIGSSSENLELAIACQTNLQPYAEVTVWSQGVFEPSSTSLQSLENELEKSDFGLFLFSPDDIVFIRKEENQSVRDNVIFELGMFVGYLGHERSFVITPSDTEFRMPSDLIGLTTAQYDTSRSDDNLESATAVGCQRIAKQINLLGIRDKSSPSAGAVAKINALDNEHNDDGERGDNIEQRGDPESTDEDDWFPFWIEQKYEEAVEKLENVARSEKDPAKVFVWKALIARIKYDIEPEEGIIALESLIKTVNENPIAHVHLFYILMVSGKIKKAKDLSVRTLEAYPSKHEVHAMAARYYAKIGDDANQLAVLQNAVTSCPDAVEPVRALAEYYVDEEKYEEARAVYENGDGAIPKNELILEAYARLLANHFDQREALVIYNQLVALNHESTNHVTYRGNTYLALNCPNEAMADYMKGDELADGSEAWILANRGNLLRTHGFNTQGLEYLDKALQIEPDMKYALQRKAEVLTSLEEEKDRVTKLMKEGELKLARRKAGLAALGDEAEI